MPVDVGVPDSTPAVLSVMPGGKVEPAVTDHTIVADSSIPSASNCMVP